MANLPALFILLSLFLVTLTESKGPGHGRRVVCYMASWGRQLAGLGRFDIPEVDKAGLMCTHLVYLFAYLHPTDNSIIPLDARRDIDEGGYNQSVALKNQYPHLKVMIGLGGWVDSEGEKYSKMVKEPANRAKFIDSVVKFLGIHGLDGLDFNWQFPGQRGGNPVLDKSNFVLLVKEMREVFDKRGWILSLATSAFKDRIDVGFDVKNLAENAHFLNVLSYEYHQTWSGRVGPSAPLYAADNFCINDTVHRYLELGAPAYKINMGLSTYGTNYNLANPSTEASIIGQHITGHGFKGTYNDVDGFLAYNELCFEMEAGGWTQIWDDVSQTPFARNGGRVVSYDDARSYTAKIKYAMELQLGGVIFYGLEKDDFRGTCISSKGQYPMLTSIHQALLKYSKYDYNDLRILCKTHPAKFFWNGLK